MKKVLNLESILPVDRTLKSRCFVLSLHKHGSTMMNDLIRRTCSLSHPKVPFVAYPEHFFQKGYRFNDWQFEKNYLPAFDHNVIYVGFRELPKIFSEPEFSNHPYKFVLLLRDPRDALVSQYFSYGRTSGSHVVPKGMGRSLEEYLQIEDELSIDDYVLKEAPKLAQQLNNYKSGLNFENGAVFLYEEVYYDKLQFGELVFDFFDIPVEPRVQRKAAELVDIRPEKEDATKHIRKGAPGDHLNKLKPKTIAKLNDILRDAYSDFGYEF